MIVTVDCSAYIRRQCSDFCHEIEVRYKISSISWRIAGANRFVQRFSMNRITCMR